MDNIGVCLQYIWNGNRQNGNEIEMDFTISNYLEQKLIKWKQTALFQTIWNENV